MATTARFDKNMPKNKDNTARLLTNDYQTPVYAATLNVVTKASDTLVKPGTLTGAMTINIAVGSSTTAPFVGDKITFLLTPDATSRTVTFGTGTSNIGTLVLAISKKGFASFMFDGAVWVQTGAAAGA